MIQLRVPGGPTPAGLPKTRPQTLTVIVTAILLMGFGGRLSAQGQASETVAAWSELPVPGGRFALSRILNLDPGMERARMVLETVRLIYDAPWGSSSNLAVRFARLDDYLVAIERLQDARASGSFGLPLAEGAATRQRLTDTLEGLGLTLRKSKGGYLVEAARSKEALRTRELLTLSGLQVEEVSARLNSGEVLSISIPIESAPLPFDVGIWSRTILNRPVTPDRLLSAIIRDREAALLYHGLMALDASTLAYLAAHPGLLGRIYDSSAPSFSVFGRALRVADGAVQVPGGHRARSLWEALVAEPVTKPDRFIQRVLERDKGRLAYFYDTVFHLDEPRQAFALGLGLNNTRVREERFRDLYLAVASADPAWKITDRPFSRSSHDASMLLGQVLVAPSGQVEGPNWRRLWDAVFETDDFAEEPERTPADLESGGVIDATWLVERICLAEASVRVERFTAFMFAQRAFSRATREQLPDVLVALRAFSSFRSLSSTLERIGVTDPSVYAATVRHAARLGRLDRGDKEVIRLTQFQGALALVERMRLARTIDAGEVNRLMGALAGARLSGDRYDGAIGSWLNDWLTPVVTSTEQPVERSVERAMLTAMAGRESADRRTFNWEGVSYRLAPAAAALTRMEKLRQAGGGNTLDPALQLARDLDEIGRSNDPRAALLAAREPLEKTLSALIEIPSIGLHVLEAEDHVSRKRREAIDGMRELETGHAGDARAVLERLTWLCDATLADALLKLAYVGSLGSMGVSESEAARLSNTHDFGSGSDTGARPVRRAWQVPRETVGDGGPARIVGSLLGLDLGLARLALRRMVSEPPQRPPVLNANLRETFVENVVLMNPFDLRDGDRDFIVNAIDAGRRRVLALTGDASALENLANEIRLSEWRRRALPWILRHEPEQVGKIFSRLELFWLGCQSEELPGGLNAWGTPKTPLTGCPCLEFPQPQGFEEFAGRPMSGQLAARVPDLILRTAELLARQGLPATIARDVLAVATQDFVDRAEPAYSDDWVALVRYVYELPDEQLQDYVSSVAAQGPMIAVSDSDSGGHAR